MKGFTKFGIVVLGLFFVLLAGGAWCFPLWLDSPVRSNGHDPKSLGATPVPQGTATPIHTPTPLGTATPVNSPTSLATATSVQSPTALATATSVQSPTPLGTATPMQSPTGSPTSIASSTFTTSPTPAPPSATPTQTLTPCSGCQPTPTFEPTVLITDFESGDSRSMGPAFAQGLLSVGGYGGSVSPGYFDFNSATGPGSNATGAASALAGCLSGSTTNGFYHFDFCFTCGGGGSSGCTNISSDFPANRLVFDFKSNAAGVAYTAQITQPCISALSSQGAYYSYDFTPVDTNWHQYVVYFPGSIFDPQFALPNWATPVAWDATQIQNIEFIVKAGSTTVNFDFCVDNMVFK